MECRREASVRLRAEAALATPSGGCDGFAGSAVLNNGDGVSSRGFVRLRAEAGLYTPSGRCGGFGGTAVLNNGDGVPSRGFGAASRRGGACDAVWRLGRLLP